MVVRGRPQPGHAAGLAHEAPGRHRGHHSPQAPGDAVRDRRLRAGSDVELSELRADGTIGDDAFHQVEEELDRAELNAQAMNPEG